MRQGNVFSIDVLSPIQVNVRWRVYSASCAGTYGRHRCCCVAGYTIIYRVIAEVHGSPRVELIQQKSCPKGELTKPRHQSGRGPPWPPPLASATSTLWHDWSAYECITTSRLDAIRWRNSTTAKAAHYLRVERRLRIEDRSFAVSWPKWMTPKPIEMGNDHWELVNYWVHCELPRWSSRFEWRSSSSELPRRVVLLRELFPGQQIEAFQHTSMETVVTVGQKGVRGHTTSVTTGRCLQVYILERCYMKRLVQGNLRRGKYSLRLDTLRWTATSRRRTTADESWSTSPEWTIEISYFRLFNKWKFPNHTANLMPYLFKKKKFIQQVKGNLSSW